MQGYYSFEREGFTYRNIRAQNSPKLGMIFFAQRSDGRTVRIPGTWAIQAARATEFGLEFRPGVFLDYDQLQIGHRQVIWFKNATWLRDKFKGTNFKFNPADQRAGLTVIWEDLNDGEIYMHDIGVKIGVELRTRFFKELIKGNVIIRTLADVYDGQEIFNRMTQMMSRIVTGEYDHEVVFEQLPSRARVMGIESRKSGQTETVRVAIREAYFFRDTFIQDYDFSPSKK